MSIMTTSGTIEVKNVLNATDHDFTLTINIKNVDSGYSSPYSEYIKLNKYYNVKFKYLNNGNLHQGLYCFVKVDACDIDNFKQDKLLMSVKYLNWNPQTYITCYNQDQVIAKCHNITTTYELFFLITASTEYHTITSSVTQTYGGTLQTMYDDETFLDFKLVVKESSEATGENSVGFHRNVLAAWSPVMMKMFSNSWKEKNEGVLEMPVKLEVIKAFKKYVYTEELPEDRETLLGLVELGSYYMNPKLEISASESIIEMIAPDEIWETISYSVMKKTNKLSRLLLMKVHFAKRAEFDKVIDEIDKL